MNAKNIFSVGDIVDRKIDPMFDKWSEGWKVIKMPTNFIPLSNCIYVEKELHIVGVSPDYLRHSLSSNPKID